jgi:hypothetical protein
MPNLITCSHLQPVESAAYTDKVGVTATGDWWGSGSTKNVYLDCSLDRSAVEAAFLLPMFVEWYEYDGRVAEQEAGFRCKQCNSILVGNMAGYSSKVWP